MSTQQLEEVLKPSKISITSPAPTVFFLYLTLSHQQQNTDNSVK